MYGQISLKKTRPLASPKLRIKPSILQQTKLKDAKEKCGFCIANVNPAGSMGRVGSCSFRYEGVRNVQASQTAVLIINDSDVGFFFHNI